MLCRALVILACVWVGVYEASYAVYEYGRGNRKGSVATAILCLAVLVFAVGVGFKLN